MFCSDTTLFWFIIPEQPAETWSQLQCVICRSISQSFKFYFISRQTIGREAERWWEEPSTGEIAGFQATACVKACSASFSAVPYFASFFHVFTIWWRKCYKLNKSIHLIQKMALHQSPRSPFSLKKYTMAILLVINVQWTLAYRLWYLRCPVLDGTTAQYCAGEMKSFPHF
jgi:hypothetical protein